MSEPTITKDWRVSLFGENIQTNQQLADDEELADEKPVNLVPIEEAFDAKKYEYIAVFIGANYCPHCKAFAPTVKAAVSAFEERKCKVVFLSNDRTEEDFRASCEKNLGIDVVPYNLEKTKGMRDMFELKTIPALMILKNENFQSALPTVVTNARNTLVADTECKFFPWVSDKPMTMMDRFIIRGKYGKWWELGHHINPDFRKFIVFQ